MFKRRPAPELELPPMAVSNAQAFEVLRVWTAPGEAQEVVLKTTWKNPATWGLMLADIATHAANAYANEGHDREEALRQMLQMMNTEFADLRMNRGRFHKERVPLWAAMVIVA